MAIASYITLEDLRTELKVALKPVNDRLDKVEVTLNHVRERTNQMYDALAQHGLPLPAQDSGP